MAARRQSAPLNLPLLYDPDALGKGYKVVQVKARWLPADDCLLVRLWPKYQNIHLALFSDSSYICKRAFDGFARTQQSD